MTEIIGTKACGYWTLAWIGLLANIAALPVIAIVAFNGPPMQVANISLAISLAWPASIVGIVASAGLLADRQWGVILTIVALSMSLAASFPYSIVRIVLLNDFKSVGGISFFIAILHLLSLVYWCRPIHRRNRRL